MKCPYANPTFECLTCNIANDCIRDERQASENVTGLDIQKRRNEGIHITGNIIMNMRWSAKNIIENGTRRRRKERRWVDGYIKI